jgi:hypothetical protein
LGFSHEPRLLAFSSVASLIIISFTSMEWSSDVTFHQVPFPVGIPNCNQEMEAKCLSVCLHCHSSHSQFIVVSFCLLLYRHIHSRFLPLWEEARQCPPFWLWHFRSMGISGAPGHHQMA